MSSAMSELRWSRPLIVVAVLATACLATLGIAPRPAEAEVDFVFNVTCPLSHLNEDDPIVVPGLTGASHRHAFYGNSSTNAFTTTKSLMASKSTCERGFATFDRSAYWVPTLYRKVPGKAAQEVKLAADKQYLSAYYRRSGGSTGEKVKPFPRGLRMVAGQPFADKPQTPLHAAWRCNGDGGGYSAEIPNCPSGTVTEAIVAFPDCWDGVNLDAADHRSHMARATDRGICPKTHPVKLPQLTFEISFKLSPVAGATYELSSGGRYSMHGDFFAAWDDKVQSALVNSCLNAGRYCENPQKSQVDLSAAGPVPQGREPTVVSPSASASAGSSAPAGHGNGHGLDSAQHSADASPGPIAAVPVGAPAMVDRVAGVLAGVGAVVVIGSAVLYSRRRRRSNGPSALG
jgi:hypothetical protein